jgi:hydrogenase maturation protease
MVGEPIGDADGPILVIGYGNPLRGDDGVGPRAAEALSARALPGVVALGTHQLLPELAEPLSAARLAVFVDARLADGEAKIRVRPIAPIDSSAPIGHVGDPGRLLALARDAFGACPRAWLVTIPAVDLSLGEGLSPVASAGLDEAIGHLLELLETEGILRASESLPR